MPTFYLYMHLQEDGLPFYIGKGIDDGGCFVRANKEQDRTQYWHNVKNKHGKLVVILHTGLSENEVFFWEKFYIKIFGRRDQNSGSLVNMTDGGEGGANRFTPEKRSEIVRKGHLKKTPEQKSKGGIISSSKITSVQRAERLAKVDPAVRKRNAQAMSFSLTYEQRCERAKKGAMTRALNKEKRRAEK